MPAARRLRTTRRHLPGELTTCKAVAWGVACKDASLFFLEQRTSPQPFALIARLAERHEDARLREHVWLRPWLTSH